MTTLYRTLSPKVRVLDAKAGIAEYIASDETLDSYREVIKASGWRFNHFEKNSPLVDSHNYDSIGALVGKVLDFKVSDHQLIETAQWAIDVPENKLAQIGWKMTEAGYLKAVSVGFWPTKMVTKWDSDRAPYLQQLSLMGVPEAQGPRIIYLEQEQIELSVCIVGANPNALARAYKSGAVTDADLDTLSQEHAKLEHSRAPDTSAEDALARQRTREAFLRKLTPYISQL